MKNLFESTTMHEVIARIASLSPTSPRKWGRWTSFRWRLQGDRLIRVLLREDRNAWSTGLFCDVFWRRKASFAGKMLGWREILTRPNLHSRLHIFTVIE